MCIIVLMTDRDSLDGCVNIGWVEAFVNEDGSSGFVVRLPPGMRLWWHGDGFLEEDLCECELGFRHPRWAVIAPPGGWEHPGSLTDT